MNLDLHSVYLNGVQELNFVTGGQRSHSSHTHVLGLGPDVADSRTAFQVCKCSMLLIWFPCKKIMRWSSVHGCGTGLGFATTPSER